MYIVKTLSGMKRTSSIKEALQVNQGKYIAVIVNQQIQTIWSIKQAQTISWILDVLLGSAFGKNITSIILYGSAAKNTANSDSDISLLYFAGLFHQLGYRSPANIPAVKQQELRWTCMPIKMILGRIGMIHIIEQ